tara:strand:- start:39 stop:461 length:423 start_codon:yes stop_codon:yes gene_type:complete
MSANFTVDFSGPMFQLGAINKAKKQALNDLGMVGAGFVKKRLTKGSGFVTGTLKRSISFHVRGDEMVTIDSGRALYGKDLNYAEYVETGKQNGSYRGKFRGHHMFRDGGAELEAGAARIVEEAMTGQFSKGTLKSMGFNL